MTLISAIGCPDPKVMYALCFIFITDLAKPHTAQLGRAISRFMASFDMHAGQAGDARCRCQKVCGENRVCCGCWLCFIS